MEEMSCVREWQCGNDPSHPCDRVSKFAQLRSAIAFFGAMDTASRSRQAMRN